MSGTALLLTLVSALTTPPPAPRPQWGNLEAGPHAVGFRVLQVADSTRIYVHADGRRTARPLQVVIWYPARTTAAARAMPWGEYVHLAATAQGPRPLTDSLRREAESFITQGPLQPFFGGQVPDTALRRVLATPTAAVRDAPAVGGRFPTVLTLAVSPAVEQSVRWEYLASHGYVVAGVSWAGTGAASFQRGEWSPAAMEDMGDDMRVLHDVLGRVPAADRERLGWVGAMTPAGLVFGSRSGRVDALATVEGFFPAGLAAVPTFDIARITFPVLDLKSHDAQADALADSLRFAERIVAKFATADHLSTYQFQRVAHPARSAEHTSYETIARTIRSFLDGALRRDSAAARAVRGASDDRDLAVRTIPARPPVPTEGEFLAILRYQGIDSAIAVHRAVSEREPGYQLFSPLGLINTAAFFFRDLGPARGIPATTAAYQLALSAHPRSARVREALGRWFLLGNDTVTALRHLDSALAIAPSDPYLYPIERTELVDFVRGRIAALRSPAAPAPQGPQSAAPVAATPRDTAIAAIRARVQATLDSIHGAGRFPGATAGIVLADGRSIGLAAGMSDTAARRPMRADDLLLQGSVGKTYVAAVAMQLVKEGKLRLDAPISTYLGREPWFTRLPNAATITVRMLMNHTSGLVRYEFKDEFTRDLTADPDRVWRPEQLVAYILDTPAPFAAGADWDYSDTNYIVLGMIIERVTGSTLNAEIARRVLRPLELRRTVPSDRREIPNLAQGYAGPDNPFGGTDAMIVNGKFAINPQFEWAGGGYASSAEDLARWAKAMYEGRAFERALVDTMVAAAVPAKLGPGVLYGLGVIVRPTGALGASWGHSGFFPGYITEMRYYPEHRIAVAFQVNTSVPRAVGRGPGAAVEALARAAM